MLENYTGGISPTYPVMQLEQGVYQNVRTVLIRIQMQGAPFGDHLGPGTQPGGVFEGQLPRRSLWRPDEWAKPQGI